MKNTKINFEQLKKLIKESSMGDVIDNIYDQENILSGVVTFAKDAMFYAKQIYTTDRNREHHEAVYKDLLEKLIKKLEKIKSFDAIALDEESLNSTVNEVKRLTESTPEQIEVRERAAEAKANGEYYAIGYMDSSNLYPDFVCSSKNKNEVIETAKEMMSEEDDGPFYETVNVCDPDGHVIQKFKSKEAEDAPYWGTDY